MIRAQDIWVVIPAYNEGPMIGEVVRRVRACGYPNVLVVNDGSSDDTRLRALEAGATVLSHPINRGAGAAAQTGIAYARQHGVAYLVQMDADGQHHPEDIEGMRQAMAEEEWDVLIGSRFLMPNDDVPRIRVLYNTLSNYFTNWFCIDNYSDSQSGFRMLNRRAIEQLHLTLDGFGYCSEMLVAAEHKGLRIGETPIQVSYTEYSMSKGQNLHTGILTALNLLWKLFFHQTSRRS
jgi:glycosyltransferase involved in cell wall biosynthesis